MTYKKLLSEWAEEWKKEHLNQEMLTLISQTMRDLYSGPHDEDDYPGFSAALKKINPILDTIPRTLYIDVESGFVSETEPKAEPCSNCDGTGTDIDDENCCECNGIGYFDPAGDWNEVNIKEIKQVIFGKELAEYL
jgi:hypothetical protein